MKNVIIAVSLSLLAIECKKEEAVTSSQNNVETAVSKADSALISNNSISESTSNALKVETLNEVADLGKTIFTENGKTIISFNTDNQKGKIRINGKDYELSQLNFTENNYEIKGPEIQIVATNGDFEETSSDCTYGTFPEIKIKLKDQSSTTFKNIKVQDCPNYN